MSKRSGHTCEYTVAKNAELVKVFKAEIRKAHIIDLDAIFERVAESPASRFYISEERAYLLVRAHKLTGKWSISNILRREMLEEIERRADRLMNRDCTKTLRDAIYIVVAQRAPKFFLTPRSCRTLIYSTMQRAVANQCASTIASRFPLNQEGYLSQNSRKNEY